MNAAKIINYARFLAGGVSESQISTDGAGINMEDILNKAYRGFYKRIVDLDKNYFWDRWEADTVEDQYEYSLMQPDSSVPRYWLFKPENIRIKYKDDFDYVDVFLTDWDALEHTPEYLAKNQDTSNPIGILTDTKYVHIFPTPTESVTDGLIFEWAKKPYDLDKDSAEEEILIDPLYHETIAYMMIPDIENAKSNFDKIAIAQQIADIEQLKALRSMGVLKTKAIRARSKDLSHLE